MHAVQRGWGGLAMRQSLLLATLVLAALGFSATYAAAHKRVKDFTRSFFIFSLLIPLVFALLLPR